MQPTLLRIPAIFMLTALLAAPLTAGKRHRDTAGTGRESPGRGRMLQTAPAILMSGEDLPAAMPLYGQADTVTMFIIGDVMLHSRQMEYPCSTFLEGIRGRMRAADMTVANMEFTLAGEPYTGYPAFSAPDSYAEYVHECGTDVFLTANNHILDKGMAGLLRTMRTYRDMEESGSVRFTGTSADEADNALRYPLVVNMKGIRVALVNFTYGTNVSGSRQAWPKVNMAVREDISAAMERARRRKADFIIALPHWGNEYQLEHSSGQERIARWMVAEGADAVVGAHPHVVQDSCSMGGVPVFYSIGNAVSNMSAENTQLELAVELKFVRNADGDLSMIKPHVTFLWCSRPGELLDNYKVIAVEDYIGRRDLWRGGHGYDKMLRTYRHVKAVTGIRDAADERMNAGPAE